jgi:hypothetical protein
MRYLVLTAIALAVAAMPTGGHAEAGKKIHKYHIHRSHTLFESRGAVPVDPTGGNAAAGGNNGNSMSGSNSAGENAEGRTSGGRS